MARRTKEESEQTRQQILAAARDMFVQRGVTRTTMEQIAAAAGVTRGAVYWHFANKMALYLAMRDQVSLPLIDPTDYAQLRTHCDDPLERLARFLSALVATVVDDDITRRTFEIMTFKCEYVDEFSGELETMQDRHHEFYAKLLRIHRQARRGGYLREGVDPETAAADTMIFIGGLIRLWLLDTRATLIRPRVAALIAAHIESRRDSRRDSRRPIAGNPA